MKCRKPCLRPPLVVSHAPSPSLSLPLLPPLLLLLLLVFVCPPSSASLSSHPLSLLGTGGPPLRSQDGPSMGPGWFQDGPRMGLGWSQDGPRMGPGWAQTLYYDCTTVEKNGGGQNVGFTMIVQRLYYGGKKRRGPGCGFYYDCTAIVRREKKTGGPGYVFYYDCTTGEITGSVGARHQGRRSMVGHRAGHRVRHCPFPIWRPLPQTGPRMDPRWVSQRKTSRA